MHRRPASIRSTAKRRAPPGSTATVQARVPSSDLPERCVGSNAGATTLPLGLGGERLRLRTYAVVSLGFDRLVWVEV